MGKVNGASWVVEKEKMELYTITADDEFGRRFNYSYGMTGYQLRMSNIDRNNLYKFILTKAVHAINLEMGSATKATWTCATEEL